MALSDAKRLYDITTRQQVYIEGVKAHQARQLNFVLAELKEELDKLLRRVDYKTLDGLTKAELNRLILSLRESQTKVYSKYQEQLITDLKAFTVVNLEVTQIALASGATETEFDFEPLTVEEAEEAIEDSEFTPIFGLPAATAASAVRLWSTIANNPISANGIYVVPFVKGFTVAAQAGIENTIRKAYANKWTLEDTIAALTGTSTVQGASSQIQKMSVQSNAVVSTAVQHVNAIVAAAVGSALFGFYRWHSVIDNNTTEICQHRNGKRYRYGAGPIPPAHINCRSHIAPSVGTDGGFVAESFFEWIRRQPDDLQDDMLGKKGGEGLRSGKLKAKDLTKFETSKPLTLAQFRRKVTEILTR